MILAGTGHRAMMAEDEQIVRQKIRNVLNSTDNIECVITGMANGFDLWLGDEARAAGYEIWAAKPWAGHFATTKDYPVYTRVLEAASRVINVVDVKDFPGNYCYHERNHWMVDNCTHVLAYLNPAATSGGTYECVKYARGKKPIRNIYEAAPF